MWLHKNRCHLSLVLFLLLLATGCCWSFYNPASKVRVASQQSQLPPSLLHLQPRKYCSIHRPWRKPNRTTGLFFQQHSTNPSFDPFVNPNHGGSANTSAAAINRRMMQWWSDFYHGAYHVHSHYLDICWNYGIRLPLLVMLPFLILLAASSHFHSLFLGSTLHTVTSACLAFLSFLSDKASHILGLPIVAVTVWFPKQVFTMLLQAFDYIPRPMVVAIVRSVLYIQNHVQRFLTLPSVAILLDHFLDPVVVEVKYRYLLDQVLGDQKRFRLRRQQTTKRHYLPSKRPQTAGSDSSTRRERQLNIPMPYYKNDKTSAMSTRGSSSSPSPSSPPIMPWIRLSTILLATGQLYKLTPEIYLVGDVIHNLFSQYWGNSLWFAGPGSSSLQFHTIFVWLTIYQALCTGFVSWYVLTPLYQQGGILASIGGHVAWCMGIVTILPRLVLRMLWKVPFIQGMAQKQVQRPQQQQQRIVPLQKA